MELESQTEAAAKSLEILLSKSKTQKVSEISEGFCNLFFSGDVPSEEAMRVAPLFSKVSTKIIGDVFKRNWNSTDAERRELALTELFKLKGSHAVEKQVAVAEKIGPIDSTASAEILYHILSAATAKSTEIPKNTEELLRTRFLAPDATPDRWIKYKNNDPAVVRKLIITFIGWASDTKFESLGFLHHFLRWAITTSLEAGFDESERTSLLEKVIELKGPLPDVAKNELDALLSPTHRSELPTISPPESEGRSEGPALQGGVDHGVTADNRQESSKTESTPSEISRIKSPIEASPSEILTLVAETELWLRQKRQEYSLIEELLTTVQDLNSKLERENGRVHTLTLRIDSLEGAMKSLESENQKLINEGRGLRSDFEDAKNSLRQRTEELDEERKEYAKKIEERIQREIENFKGKLKQRLNPIFANKKSTDGNQLSNDLAGFLRKWSETLEKELRALGIDL